MAFERLTRAVLELAADSKGFFQDLDAAEARAKKLGAKFREAGKGLATFGKDAKSVGTALSVGLTAPIVGIGAAVLKLGTDYDGALRTISVGTGATGQALRELGEDFRNAFTRVPDDVGTVSTAISDMNTITGAAGDTLSNLVTQVLDASRLLDEEGAPNAKAFAQALQQFQIDAANAGPVLDAFFAVSQKTGIGLNQLIEEVKRHGATLQANGFTIKESALLLGVFDKAGLDSQKAVRGLQRAQADWAKEGKNSAQGLRDLIAGMQAAKTDTDAAALAVDAFGAGPASTMATAVRNGVLSLDDLSLALEETEGLVADTVASNQSLTDEFREMWHAIANELAPAGERLVQVIREWIPRMKEASRFVAGLVQRFAEASPAVQATVVGIAAATAAVGPLLLGIGALSSGLGTAMSAAGSMASAIGKIPFGAMGSALTNNIGLLGKVGAVGAAAFVGWQFGTLIRNIGGIGEKLDGLVLKLFNLKAAPGLGDIVASPEDQAAIQRAFELMQKGLVPREAIENVADAQRILAEYNAKLRESSGVATAAADGQSKAGAAAAGAGISFGTANKELEKFKLGQQSILVDAANLNAALLQLRMSGDTLSKEGLAQVVKVIQELRQENLALPPELAAVAMKFNEFGLTVPQSLPPVLVALGETRGELMTLTAEAIRGFQAMQTEGFEPWKLSIGTVGTAGVTTADQISAAFQRMGIKTRAESEATMKQMEKDFKLIAESHEASAKQITEAKKKLDEFRRQSSTETASIETQNTFDMVGSVAGHLSQLGGKFGKYAAAAGTIAAFLSSVKTMAETPWPLNIPLAAAALAAGMAVVGKIRSVNSFEEGTPKLDFANFGPEMPALLHGPEAVIPQGGGHLLGAEVADELDVRLADERRRSDELLQRVYSSLHRQPHTIARAIRHGLILAGI